MLLHTDRLVLRDIGEDDIDTIVAFFGEPAAQRDILAGQRDPAFVERLARFHAAYAARVPSSEREFLNCAVALRDGGTLIGTCSLTCAYAGSTGSRIGWHFGQAHSGRGYATEAAGAVVRHAFAGLGIERIIGDCFATNERSRRIFARLGMRQVGLSRLRRWKLALDYMDRRPLVRYALARDEAANGPGGHE